MKIILPPPPLHNYSKRIAYNSSHNTQQNSIAQTPQLLSNAENSFLDELNALQNYNLSFLGKTTARPVLAIDREMNYEPYSSANKAGTVLGIATPRISKCIKEDKEQRAKYAGDYYFVPLCEVQTVKEDGTLGIDEDKVREVYEAGEIARIEGENVKKHRFYGMDKNKKLIPFTCYSEAEKVTPAKRPNIIKCLNGDNKTAGGYIFFEPEEIEIIDETGKIDIDKEKLDSIMKRADEYLSNPYIGEKTPVYAFYIGTKKKKDIRFDTITEAKKKLETSYESIAACLAGDKNFAGDYCYALASEIETIKEDGTVDIDIEKIDKLKEEAKIAKENDKSMKGKAIYAYKIKDKSLKRYNISADAAHLLKISPANISACLADKNEVTSGFIFLPAYKIEVENEDGVLVPDEEKLKTALREHHEKAAACQAERAAKRRELKKTKTTKKKIKTTNTTVKKNNKTDKKKPLLDYTVTPVAVSTPAFITIPESKAASNESKKSISKSAKTAKPKTAKAKDPAKSMRKYIKLGRIYAYKYGNYFEYADIFEACTKLNTDLDTLYNAIKINSNKINGLVFTTDADY